MRKIFIWSPCQWLRETKQLFGEALDVNLSMDKERAFENGFHYVVLAGNVCLLAKVKESSQADLMGTVEYQQSGQDWGICSNEHIRRYNMIQLYNIIYIYIYLFIYTIMFFVFQCPKVVVCPNQTRLSPGKKSSANPSTVHLVFAIGHGQQLFLFVAFCCTYCETCNMCIHIYIYIYEFSFR